jgi:hypothetical protein
VSSALCDLVEQVREQTPVDVGLVMRAP